MSNPYESQSTLYSKCRECGLKFPFPRETSLCKKCLREMAKPDPLPFDFHERCAWSESIIKQYPSLLKMIEALLKKTENELPQGAAYLEGIEKLKASRGSLIQSIQTAKAYNTLAVEYLKGIEELAKLREEPGKEEMLADVYGRWRHLHNLLDKRRQGTPGNVSDFKRWVLASEYNCIFGPFPQREVLKKYSIPIPEPGEKVSVNKSEVFRRMAKEHELKHANQCAGILRNMDVFDKPPKKIAHKGRK